MGQLQLLWDLENFNNLLESQIKQLDLMQNNIQIKEMEKLAEKINRKLLVLKKEINKNKSTMREDEQLLKEYSYRLKNIDRDLYDGKISDLKQLDFLTCEKDKVKNWINDLETKIINALDELENMEIETNNLEDRLNLVIKKILRDKEVFSKTIRDIEEEISKNEEECKLMESHIDLALLNRYKVLRSNRGKGIVSVEDNICGGCNMMIPTYLRETIKTNLEIIYCESCGRILYYANIDNKEPSK